MRINNVVQVLSPDLKRVIQTGAIIDMRSVNGELQCRIYCTPGKPRALSTYRGWVVASRCKVIR